MVKLHEAIFPLQKNIILQKIIKQKTTNQTKIQTTVYIISFK